MLWTNFTPPSRLSPARTETAEEGTAPVSAAQALAEYLRLGQQQGTVLAELPHRVMDTRLAPDGHSVDVVYVRRWVERATIDRVFEIGHDERGNPTSIPVSPTRFVSTGPH